MSKRKNTQGQRAVRQNSDVIGQQDSDVIGWQDSDIIVKQNSNVISRQNNDSAISGQNSNVIGRHDSDVIGRQNSNAISRQNSDVSSRQDSDVISRHRDVINWQDNDITRQHGDDNSTSQENVDAAKQDESVVRQLPAPRTQVLGLRNSFDQGKRSTGTSKFNSLKEKNIFTPQQPVEPRKGVPQVVRFPAQKVCISLQNSKPKKGEDVQSSFVKKVHSVGVAEGGCQEDEVPEVDRREAERMSAVNKIRRETGLPGLHSMGKLREQNELSRKLYSYKSCSGITECTQSKQLGRITYDAVKQSVKMVQTNSQRVAPSKAGGQTSSTIFQTLAAIVIYTLCCLGEWGGPARSLVQFKIERRSTRAQYNSGDDNCSNSQLPKIAGTKQRLKQQGIPACAKAKHGGRTWRVLGAFILVLLAPVSWTEHSQEIQSLHEMFISKGSLNSEQYQSHGSRLHRFQWEETGVNSSDAKVSLMIALPEASPRTIAELDTFAEILEEDKRCLAKGPSLLEADKEGQLQVELLTTGPEPKFDEGGQQLDPNEALQVSRAQGVVPNVVNLGMLRKAGMAQEVPQNSYERDNTEVAMKPEVHEKGQQMGPIEALRVSRAQGVVPDVVNFGMLRRAKVAQEIPQNSYDGRNTMIATNPEVHEGGQQISLLEALQDSRAKNVLLTVVHLVMLRKAKTAQEIPQDSYEAWNIEVAMRLKVHEGGQLMGLVEALPDSRAWEIAPTLINAVVSRGVKLTQGIPLCNLMNRKTYDVLVLEGRRGIDPGVYSLVPLHLEIKTHRDMKGQFKLLETFQGCLHVQIQEGFKDGAPQPASNGCDSLLLLGGKVNGTNWPAQGWKMLKAFISVKGSITSKASECDSKNSLSDPRIFGRLRMRSELQQKALDVSPGYSAPFKEPKIEQLNYAIHMGLSSAQNTDWKCVKLVIKGLHQVAVCQSYMGTRVASHEGLVQSLEEALLRLKECTKEVIMRSCSLEASEMKNTRAGHNKDQWLWFIKNSETGNEKATPDWFKRVKTVQDLFSFFPRPRQQLAQNAPAGTSLKLNNIPSRKKSEFPDKGFITFFMCQSLLNSKLLTCARKDRMYEFVMSKLFENRCLLEVPGSKLSRIQFPNVEASNPAKRKIIDIDKECLTLLLLEMPEEKSGMEMFDVHLRGQHFLLLINQRKSMTLENINCLTLNPVWEKLPNSSSKRCYKHRCTNLLLGNSAQVRWNLLDSLFKIDTNNSPQALVLLFQNTGWSVPATSMSDEFFVSDHAAWKKYNLNHGFCPIMSAHPQIQDSLIQNPFWVKVRKSVLVDYDVFLNGIPNRPLLPKEEGKRAALRERDKSSKKVSHTHKGTSKVKCHASCSFRPLEKRNKEKKFWRERDVELSHTVSTLDGRFKCNRPYSFRIPKGEREEKDFNRQRESSKKIPHTAKGPNKFKRYGYCSSRPLEGGREEREFWREEEIDVSQAAATLDGDYGHVVVHAKTVVHTLISTKSLSLLKDVLIVLSKKDFHGPAFFQHLPPIQPMLWAGSYLLTTIPEVASKLETRLADGCAKEVGNYEVSMATKLTHLCSSLVDDNYGFSSVRGKQEMGDKETDNQDSLRCERSLSPSLSHTRTHDTGLLSPLSPGLHSWTLLITLSNAVNQVTAEQQITSSQLPVSFSLRILFVSNEHSDKPNHSRSHGARADENWLNKKKHHQADESARYSVDSGGYLYDLNSVDSVGSRLLKGSSNNFDLATASIQKLTTLIPFTGLASSRGMFRPVRAQNSPELSRVQQHQVQQFRYSEQELTRQAPYLARR